MMFNQKLFNMKNLLFILITLIMVSCGSSSVETVDNVADGVVDTASVSEAPGGGEFSNPNIIMGSDFLTFFKSLRKMGEIDQMVKFTHSESINEHGVDAIKEYYENKFTNMSDAKLKNTEDMGDGTFVMNYTNRDFATKRAVSITVKVENDTCKLLITEPLNKRLL
jgi:hypothetical protein